MKSDKREGETAMETVSQACSDAHERFHLLSFSCLRAGFSSDCIFIDWAETWVWMSDGLFPLPQH